MSIDELFQAPTSGNGEERKPNLERLQFESYHALLRLIAMRGTRLNGTKSTREIEESLEAGRDSAGIIMYFDGEAGYEVPDAMWSFLDLVYPGNDFGPNPNQIGISEVIMSVGADGYIHGSLNLNPSIPASSYSQVRAWDEAGKLEGPWQADILLDPSRGIISHSQDMGVLIMGTQLNFTTAPHATSFAVSRYYPRDWAVNPAERGNPLPMQVTRMDPRVMQSLITSVVRPNPNDQGKFLINPAVRVNGIV